LGYSASGSSTASAESSVTQAVWKYLICGSMPVPSFDVAKNGGKRVGSCGPKRFWSKLIVDVGVEVGFNGFHRILSFLCRSWSLNSTPGAREQKTADLHRWRLVFPTGELLFTSFRRSHRRCEESSTVMPCTPSLPWSFSVRLMQGRINASADE
jgi:hypothetical protein